jgi:hypothetical protein
MPNSECLTSSHDCSYWLCCADDESIINVTEVLHNLPFLPRVFRALWTTIITTAGLTVSGW